MFLFFANGDNPVLTGLMAGEAASHANNEHREQLVQRAMTILQQIFPLCPARVSSARRGITSNALWFQPVNCAVTMWHLDRFSRGCYSYLSTQCSRKFPVHCLQNLQYFLIMATVLCHAVTIQ